MTQDNLSGNGPLSVPQRVSGTLAQTVSTPDVGEGCARIGMSGEVLQVDDVGSPFASGGEGRYPQRMDRHRRIELKFAGILFHEGLDCTFREGSDLESVSALSPSGRCRAEHRPVRIITKASLVEPREDALDGFGMQRNTTLLPALAEEFEYLVPTTLLEVTHAQSSEFSDTTGGIGEDAEDRSVTKASRSIEIRSFEQASAVLGGEADSFSIARHARSLNEAAVGGVRPGVTVGLQIREE